MSTFSTYAGVKKDNFAVTPYSVNKEYVITTASFASRGYVLYEGRYKRSITPISSSKAQNDPVNLDGTYMHIAYRSLRHRYYNKEKSALYNAELPAVDELHRNLFLTSSAIYFPYYDYGEGIKRNSFILTDVDNNIIIRDDGNGNLYDSSITTASFASSDNIILDLTWDTLIPYTKDGVGSIVSGTFDFKSSNHSPDQPAVLRNVTLQSGLVISGSNFGSSLYFSSSYVHVKNNKYLTFDTNEDLSVSFWIKTNTNTDQESQYLISKRGTFEYIKYGDYTDFNDKGESINKRGLYPVEENVQTTIYPLSFEYLSSGSNLGKIRFKRSDGNSTITMLSTNTVNDNNYHHVCFSKSGSNLYLYIDGVVQVSGSDVSGDVFNYHDYVIGALDIGGSKAFEGSLFDVKIYNTALSSIEVTAMATTSSIACRQTANVGNIFYKTGVAAITSPFKKYHDIFNGNYNICYRNTVTHYEMSTYVVIDREKFNYTFNPTATEGSKGGRYIPEMISGSLTPYITTVGLYNADNMLVAVGKLASPLRKRDDVDTTLLIRIDV